MLNRIYSIICWISLPILILGACTPIDNVMRPSQTGSTTALPVKEITGVPDRLFTLTPSSTLTLPVTFTPIPLLSKENADAVLIELLQTNGGCELPCWWGLIPGKSAPIDAYKKLITFGNIANIKGLSYNGGETFITYTKGDLYVDIDVITHSSHDEKTIEMIKIFTQARHGIGSANHQVPYGAAEYNKLLGGFSVQSILSKYGSPSQVLLRADIYNSENPDTFEVTLLYPEQGIFARYDTVAEEENNVVKGCPSKAFAELWLLSPNDKNSYQTMLSSMDATWEENFPYSKSVEEAASMTVEEFYQKFKEPTSDCLETPLNIWPGH